MRLPCWNFTAGATALFGLVCLGRLKCCGLCGLPRCLALCFCLSGCRCSASPGLPAPVFLPPPRFGSRSSLSCSCCLTCFRVFAFALAFSGRHARYVTGFSRFACVGWLPCFSWLARRPAGLPVVTGFPAVAGLPVAFPAGFETCPACACFFFGCSFFFSCCAPSCERRERETAN